MAQDRTALADIVVPELGESILEATVSRWLKQEGDPVQVGEAVVELETDKVNLEVGASAAGVLRRIDRKEGEDVNIGDVLGAVEEGGEAQPVRPSGNGESQPAAQQAEPPVERQAAAPRSRETQPPRKEPATEGQAEAQASVEWATPVAERLARQHEIDLEAISGTGVGGRVTKRDLERYLENVEAPPEQKTAPPEPAPQMPVVGRAELDGDRREERVKMSRRRRTIAARLVEAQQTAAMLSTFNEVDMSAVMDLRARRNPEFQERYGIKLGIVSFFIKAAIGALKAFPRLNAEIDGDEMVLKHYYDIGVAVGAEEGLVVPVLHHADRMSFAEIEQRINRLVQKTREGSLTLEDLRGGTFSITNGGVFGSLLSTPILSPPQSGILGLHKIEKRPVVVGEEVVIRPMMYLALTYDHRIVDGREAVQFLVRIKELIEDPEAMLLEG